MISVPAKSEENVRDSWAGAFNYKALGQMVDTMQIMTYDQHGPWSEPGPIAGLDWVQECINYAKTVIPAEKISIGIPAYVYEWNLSNGKGQEVPWRDLPERIGANPIKWDAASSSPYVELTESGMNYVLWFENKQSLRLKMDFARSSGVQGISVWALNDENAEFWEDLLGTT